MVLRKWYNFCFSYNADTDNVTAILNGDVIFRYHNDGMNEVSKHQFSGSFYMSCTDPTYGTTSKFFGRLTDLQVCSYDKQFLIFILILDYRYLIQLCLNLSCKTLQHARRHCLAMS